MVLPSSVAGLLAAESFPNRLEALVLASGVAVLVGTFLLVWSWTFAPSAPRRRRRRRGGGGRPQWGTPEAVEVPTATVPLPWQTVKPTAEAARSARAPAPDAPVPVAPAPDAPVPAPPAPPTDRSRSQVGPAPTSVPEGAVGAGWYPDPAEPTRARWWDGRSWTDAVR